MALKWKSFWQYSRTFRAFSDCVALFSCIVSMEALGSVVMPPVKIIVTVKLFCLLFCMGVKLGH